MTVVIIFTYDTGSWNSVRHFAAVAQDREAALKWIEEETQKDRYAQGISAEEWLKMGNFILEEKEVFENA